MLGCVIGLRHDSIQPNLFFQFNADSSTFCTIKAIKLESSLPCIHFPANTGRLTNVVLMFAHRLRRWTNITTSHVSRCMAYTGLYRDLYSHNNAATSTITTIFIFAILSSCKVNVPVKIHQHVQLQIFQAIAYYCHDICVLVYKLVIKVYQMYIKMDTLTSRGASPYPTASLKDHFIFYTCFLA